MNLKGLLGSVTSHPADRLRVRASGKTVSVRSPSIRAGLLQAQAQLDIAASRWRAEVPPGCNPRVVVLLMPPLDSLIWSAAELKQVGQSIPEIRGLARQLGVDLHADARVSAPNVRRVVASLRARIRTQLEQFAKNVVSPKFGGVPVALCWTPSAAVAASRGEYPLAPGSVTLVGTGQSWNQLIGASGNPAPPPSLTAAAQPPSARRKPLHAVSWAPPRHQAAANVYPMSWATSWRPVADTKRDLMQVPPEYRTVLVFGDLGSGIFNCSLDSIGQGAGSPTASPSASPWMTNGIESAKRRMVSYLDQLSQTGATPASFVFDNESTPTATWFIGGAVANWNAVMADSRFPDLAAKLGFSNLNEIGWGNPQFHKWEQVMASDFDDAMNFAFVEPIRAKFPEATASNYESYQVSPMFPTPDSGGFRQVRVTAGVGARQSRQFYGTTSNQLANCRFDGVNPLGASPFDAFRREVHAVRALRLASPMPIDAWIANKSWSGHPYPTPLANSPYWDELVIQLAINGADRFIYWTEVTMPYWPHLNEESKNPASESEHLDRLIAELNGRMPMSSTFPAPKLPLFDDEVIASVIQVGEQALWRFSFAPDIDGITVYTTGGTAIDVDREPERAGGWLLLPPTAQLAMDSESRLPRFTAKQSVAHR